MQYLIIIHGWPFYILALLKTFFNISSFLPSSCPYYFENATRFASTDFKPSEEDYLNSRAKTTGNWLWYYRFYLYVIKGITHTLFKIGSSEITIVDVGGQQSERRKWLHCFDDVTSVIFLASLEDYDLV